MGGFLGIPAHIWLQVLGVLEIAIAVMLVTQLRNIQRIASLAAGAYIAGVLTQTGWNDIAARDIAILTSALALFFLLREE
ncbi:hypothetical protein COU79_04810 [Candidatus Peregrinibacteria bacterium CG10_big_fil_rev_8_21_14_0_10_54_7]|nr:MAG: hypothetical protein COU79_04810 [Candidatus Peregrinibacteria bacterium CG10_big_fil_rev_8_21_14_0_10_54_7]